MKLNIKPIYRWLWNICTTWRPLIFWNGSQKLCLATCFILKWSGYGVMTLNTGTSYRQFDSEKSFILSHQSLVWALETTILVCFHKLMSEALKELVNAFSKWYAVITTSSSCRTVFESPKGLSGICNAHACGNQNQTKSPLNPLRWMREEWESILIYTLLKLNFYYHCVDYVCKRKQKRKGKEEVSPRICI